MRENKDRLCREIRVCEERRREAAFGSVHKYLSVPSSTYSTWYPLCAGGNGLKGTRNNVKVTFYSRISLIFVKARQK